MTILLVAEHSNNAVNDATHKAMTAAAAMGGDVHVLVAGKGARAAAEQAAKIAAQRTLPDFSPGDTLRVLVRVTEGSRTRVQAFEGVCIGRSGAGLNESFTVRKISYGEGVERVFPVYSPLVEGVEVVRRGKVRRAKLYYLRERRGKSARISENTGARARKLNEAERQAAAEEKARIEAEKIAAAEALAAEKAAQEAAEAENRQNAEAKGE